MEKYISVIQMFIVMGAICELIGRGKGRKFCFFWGLLGLIGIIIVACLKIDESYYLEKLKKLKDDGTITEEDFENKKRELLGLDKKV